MRDAGGLGRAVVRILGCGNGSESASDARFAAGHD